MKIGLISDTHGELSPRVFTLFEGVDCIVHAGDIGRSDIMVELAAIAPLTCVRGNTDKGALYEQLSSVESMETSAGLMVITHHQPRGNPPFLFPGISVAPSIIIFGHTHFPKVLRDIDVVMINPGSALYGRGAPPTVAVLDISESKELDLTYFNLLSGETFPASTSLRHGSDMSRTPTKPIHHRIKFTL